MVAPEVLFDVRMANRKPAVLSGICCNQGKRDQLSLVAVWDSEGNLQGFFRRTLTE